MTKKKKLPTICQGTFFGDYVITYWVMEGHLSWVVQIFLVFSAYSGWWEKNEILGGHFGGGQTF